MSDITRETGLGGNSDLTYTTGDNIRLVGTFGRVVLRGNDFVLQFAADCRLESLTLDGCTGVRVTTNGAKIINTGGGYSIQMLNGQDNVVSGFTVYGYNVGTRVSNAFDPATNPDPDCTDLAAILTNVDDLSPSGIYINESSDASCINMYGVSIGAYLAGGSTLSNSHISYIACDCLQLQDGATVDNIAVSNMLSACSASAIPEPNVITVQGDNITINDVHYLASPYTATDGATVRGVVTDDAQEYIGVSVSNTEMAVRSATALFTGLTTMTLTSNTFTPSCDTDATHVANTGSIR